MREQRRSQAWAKQQYWRAQYWRAVLSAGAANKNTNKIQERWKNYHFFSQFSSRCICMRERGDYPRHDTTRQILYVRIFQRTPRLSARQRSEESP